jgi:hypothetical protein
MYWTYQGIISSMLVGVESGVDPTQTPGWQDAVALGLKLLSLVQPDRARPIRPIAQTLVGTVWDIRLFPISRYFNPATRWPAKAR